MENVTKTAFHPKSGLFQESPGKLLYPNPGSLSVEHLQYFHFLGTILAKAMFEGILVDVPFVKFSLSKLKQNKQNCLTDLHSFDQEFYDHLIDMKRIDVPTHLLCLTGYNHFEKPTEEALVQGGVDEEPTELVPGGEKIDVTNDNAIAYIHLLANQRMNLQTRQQSMHFLNGFRQLIRKDWIDMFSADELQILISGRDNLDVADLRIHTLYSSGYYEEHPVIKMFWEIMKDLGVGDQKKILRIATGCSRGPLLGFEYLVPRFCIQRVDTSDDERYPTSSTCFNLLKLHSYTSKNQMQEKLLFAMRNDTGFGLE